MKYPLILLLICTTSLTALAQDKIIMQHQKRKRKQKVLSLDKIFKFDLNDGTWHYGKIQSFNTRQITIVKRDSSLVSLNTEEIELIKRFRIQKKNWTEPFYYLTYGAVMIVGATPLLWVTSGGETVVDGLEVAGMLTLVSVPALVAGSRQKRYNLDKKWRIEVR